MLVSDYSYDLPEERIAKFPPKERGSTRLLVLDRKTGATKDSFYRNLDSFLNPGDVLILNDTRVMQSRLFCELKDGRKRELVVLEKHGDEPERVMYRGKLHAGDELRIIPQESRPKPDKTSDETILIKSILGNGIAEVESHIPLVKLAELYGTVPLPPYLHRDATDDDKKRYQTVWAKHMGSAAAPTASLNMTEDLLNRLQKKGVIVKYLTLHVGLGTFLPIRTDKIEDHKMHSEWYHIPEDTIAVLKSVKNIDAGGQNTFFEGGSEPGKARNEPLAARGDGTAGRHPEKKVSDQDPRRIIALGTTVARTLEYYARTGKTEGEDDIFIYPGFEFKLVDALITNFHAPKSTVLMLASAFASWDHLKAAYDHAVAEKYHFLSYGDSMLIC